MIRIALAFLLMTTAAVDAAPPPVGSEDWQIMHPFHEWIITQHAENGNWCCDFSDGRPVDARVNADGRWEAHVTPAHWPGVPDHWLVIPDDRVLHSGNPVGVPILWYNAPPFDAAFCFVPANGM